MQNVVAEWFVTGLGMAVWGVPFLGFLFWWCKNWLTSYANKKGENLATKEDISEITSLIKSVEHGFNVSVSNLNAHHQLRMVAAERRLLAHQEAFNQWRQLYVKVASGNFAEIQAQQSVTGDWLFSNYLYLDNATRKDFSIALIGAQRIESKDGIFADAADVKIVLDLLTKASGSILQGVALPSITQGEIDSLIERSKPAPA
jgi:hypothetical protein